MRAGVRPIQLPAGRRVLVVSELRGNLSLLKGLLGKAGFSQDDVLIVLGDILERNEGSLDTLRYVMELSEKYTVHTVLGNCDNITPAFADSRGDIPDAFYERWFRAQGERCLLVKMAHLAGAAVDTAADYPAARAAINAAFGPELDFLRDLPHILVDDHHLFVHGGVPREDRLEELDAHVCMKNDDFLNQGHSFRRWVVVGHWPVTLYDPSIQCSNPRVERDRRIISLDGGCVLKVDGQLNALIIPDITGDEFSFAAYDGLPRVTALDGQEASYNPINIRWSDSAVEPLAENGDCLLVRHPSSGRTLWVPRDFVRRWRDGRLHTEDATDYCLPVAPGGELALVRETQRGLLVKKDGVTGWYHGRVERK